MKNILTDYEKNQSKKRMKVKFETSLGWVEIEVRREYYFSIINSEECKICSLFAKTINDTFISTKYIGGIGNIFEAGEKFDKNIDPKKAFMQLYSQRTAIFCNWDDILKEDIQKGKIWINIELEDGCYGSPEYKLFLVEN